MRTFTLLLITVVLASSCRFGYKSVVGSGNIIKKEETITGFSGVSLAGPIDVEVKTADSYKVTVEADDNVIKLIEVRRSGDDLEIKLKDGVNLVDVKSAKVYVETPSLKNIDLAGSGNIRSTGILSSSNRLDISSAGSGDIFVEVKSPEVKIDVAGSGKTSIKGETRKLDVSIAGSGDVDANELKSEGAEVSIAGSGNVKLFASLSLNVSIVGSGDVIYRGSPEIIKSVVGSGTIKKGE